MRVYIGQQTKWEPLHRCGLRVWEHKNHLVDGFTKKYGVHTLVWYEVHETTESAIRREKVIKNWKRAWKIRVIEQMNPTWHDLYPDLL